MDDTTGAVVLIHLFEVPAAADEAFVAGWERARDFLRDQDGYLATELHRSLAADADFRFVNLGRYQSPQAFQAAVRHADFQRAAAAIPYRAHPSLYEVIRR
jgi:heme oxygenase (mycobilin-producing)